MLSVAETKIRASSMPRLHDCCFRILWCHQRNHFTLKFILLGRSISCWGLPSGRADSPSLLMFTQNILEILKTSDFKYVMWFFSIASSYEAIVNMSCCDRIYVVSRTEDFDDNMTWSITLQIPKRRSGWVHIFTILWVLHKRTKHINIYSTSNHNKIIHTYLKTF